jgi:uncharacterized membrane protein
MKYWVFSTFLVCFIISSCTWDNAEDLYGIPDCPQDGISFAQVIEPIVQTNCAISGCHVNGQQRPILETYEQMAANAERIKARTSNGTMPPANSGKSLTLEEINAIACWVDNGAQDN